MSGRLSLYVILYQLGTSVPETIQVFESFWFCID